MFSYKRLAFSLVLLLFVFVPEFGLSYEVKVRAVNGTEEGKVAKGLPIMLHLFKEEGQSSELLESLKSETDLNGFASFTVENSRGESHLGVSTEYRGVTYSSPLLQTAQGMDNYDIPITVYELSDEDGLVYIKERRIFIQSIKDGLLTIVDRLTIANIGNKTYVGRFNDQSQLNESVRIGLPAYYERPSIEGPVDLDQIRTMGNGIVLQEMIPPGERKLFLSYKVRSDTGRFELHYSVGTPLKKLKLLIPEDFEWNVKVRKLEKTDNLTLGQTVYRQWEGRDLEINIDESTEAMDSGLRASIGYSIGPQIVLEDPTKAGLFGKNEIAISAAFVISILLGSFYIKKSGHTAMNIGNSSLSGNQSNEKLSEEKSRLYSMIKRLDRELDGNHREREIFKPHRTLLLDRIKDIDMVLKNGKAMRGSQKA